MIPSGSGASVLAVSHLPRQQGSQRACHARTHVPQCSRQGGRGPALTDWRVRLSGGARTYGQQSIERSFSAVTSVSVAAFTWAQPTTQCLPYS